LDASASVHPGLRNRVSSARCKNDAEKQHDVPQLTPMQLAFLSGFMTTP
jgi:hypothetical protein